MICQTCLKDDKRSEVYLMTEHATFVKARQTYDESGEVIPSPKMKWRTRRYQCSNGHQWEVKERV